MRIALLGPAGSFSHEAAVRNFGTEEHIFHADFEECTEAVLHSDCDYALMPFENSNSDSVAKAQLAVIARRSQLYVTALFPHHVRLQLFSYARQLAEIEEVRSIDVVFKQASVWLDQHMPQARRVPVASTSAAVHSLVETNSPNFAAIGCRQPSIVPIRVENIQTEPNTTIFCKVGRTAPNWDQVAYALVAIPDFRERDAEELMDRAALEGCGISSNWVLEDAMRQVGVFELRGSPAKSNLRNVCTMVERSGSKTFLLGGYSGKSMTRLAHEKFKGP